MSLYDDLEMEKTASSGWSSGVKLMQNQMAFKKATVASSKGKDNRRLNKLAPVIDLKSRKEEEESNMPILPAATLNVLNKIMHDVDNMPAGVIKTTDPDWIFVNEYNPLWPEDYDKVVKDMKEKRDKEERDKFLQEREERKKWQSSGGGNQREHSGFCARPRESDSEEEEERPKRDRQGGAAIAPPPSMNSPPRQFVPPPAANQNNFRGSSVAAKIMAKYGFKEGQGLGKAEQGIVRALEVEKTSKRGGRIINDRDESPPPKAPDTPRNNEFAPPSFDSGGVEDVFKAPMAPPPSTANANKQCDKSIADILKNPSKVAVLRNMVGPGEVDDDLEPEVREECREKYGPVEKVLIFQIPRVDQTEAVRIFVEFEKVDSAVKAIIDLNGRFFGGRQVAARFYDHDKFKAFKLNEPLS